MRPELYYHIIEIGVIFEKGRKSGDGWVKGEKELLLEECNLWKKFIEYASLENEGIDCSEEAFERLRIICKKFKLPNYTRIITMQRDVLNDENVFCIEEAKKNKLIEVMLNLLSNLEKCIADPNGKMETYEILRKLHNIPRALHGRDTLGGAPPITFEDALKYADFY